MRKLEERLNNTILIHRTTRAAVHYCGEDKNSLANDIESIMTGNRNMQRFITAYDKWADIEVGRPGESDAFDDMLEARDQINV